MLDVLMSDVRIMRVGHRPSGRPVLDETATGSLSRRKPGSVYPPAERSKGGPRLSPGKRFYRIASLDHFVFVSAAKQSRARPAHRHEIALSPAAPRNDPDQFGQTLL